MIRVETHQLIKLLGDLAHTTSAGHGAIGCILLHTARGPLEDEPGDTDLLVGTATDGVCTGHTYVDSYGQLPGPMLWPLADVKALLAAYKPKAAATKSKPKKHTVLIKREGSEIIVCEDPNLFSDGLTVRFTEGPISEYPRGLWDILERTPTVTIDHGDEQPRTDFHESALKPFLAVAKSRKAPLELYRYHQRARLLVQIGQRYRGCVVPARKWLDTDPRGGAGPDSDVYAPELPDEEE